MLGKGSVWAEFLTDAVRSRGRRQAKGAIRTAGVSFSLLLLGVWNGAFLAALLLACGSSTLLYFVLQHRMRLPERSLQRWLQSPQAPLQLAIASGLAVLFSTYATFGVGQDLNSPNLALLLLIQDAGMLIAFGLAVRLMLRQGMPAQAFDRCVAGLLHRDELRRLMAVRQLSDLSRAGKLSETEQLQAAEYLTLLARKETDPLVRRAITESLLQLQPNHSSQLNPSASVRRIKAAETAPLEASATVSVPTERSVVEAGAGRV